MVRLLLERSGMHSLESGKNAFFVGVPSFLPIVHESSAVVPLQTVSLEIMEGKMNVRAA